MKKMVINRGVPGSGKSFMARETAANEPSGQAVIYSTDDFFMQDGQYRFDPKRLGEFHAANVDRARMAASNGVPLIIVDNTCTQAWEAREYCRIAQDFGYEVEFQEPRTAWAKDPVECGKRNEHGVPEAAIRSMLDRWEPELTVEKCLNAKAPWEK